MAVTPLDLPYPKPRVHTNLMALCFIDRSYGRCKFNIARIGIFDLFAPVTLTSTRWLSYERDSYCLKIYRMCKYEPPTSRLSKVIVRQADRKTNRRVVKYNTVIKWRRYESIIGAHKYTFYIWDSLSYFVSRPECLKCDCCRKSKTSFGLFHAHPV